ncbi:MAG TPA: lasso peptide biosynthesis B2 protein [Vicinamibacterales bacterium]|nr:lasso peptide biosynthesis B2 protein [Vicinamibacterales bacterium]
MVILCLESGRYFTLDESARRIWTCIAEQGWSIHATAHAIAAQAGAEQDLETITADVAVFIEILKQKKLLQSGITDPHIGDHVEAVPRLPAWTWAAARLGPRRSIWSGVVGLAVTRILLRRIGLRGTLALLAVTLKNHPRRQVDERIQSVFAHRLRSAAIMCPLRTACLEQSICLLWMMRRQGVDANLRIGVAPFPFLAHAWVEHCGRPVNETADSIAMFQIMTDTFAL